MAWSGKVGRKSKRDYVGVQTRCRNTKTKTEEEEDRS